MLAATSTTTVLAFAIVAAMTACRGGYYKGPQTPAVADNTIKDGDPWSNVAQSVAADVFLNDMHHSDMQLAHPCADESQCAPSIAIAVEPEQGAHLLKRSDLARADHIIARIENKDADVAYVFGVPIPTKESAYLVAQKGGTSAVILIQTGSTQKLYPLYFETTASKEHVIGQPMAHFARPDYSGPHTTNHLTGVWVACLEGCCQASSDDLKRKTAGAVANPGRSD